MSHEHLETEIHERLDGHWQNSESIDMGIEADQDRDTSASDIGI